LEEIRCKTVPKPEKNTKTVIGGGENYGERPLFVGQGTGFRRYSCGHCKLILVDNVGENIGLVNIVLKCPGCQSYNELPS
jgi:phage FluMu protein Com